MAYWKKYYTPRTVTEAVGILAEHDGNARMIGGGTDLLLEIQQGHRPPVEALVDPCCIEGLSAIVEEGDYLVLGAGVTHTQIVNDERIRRHGTCLVESCGVIGGPQVRNVGTLAGNVAHALPAGDGTIGLLALGGEVEIASPDGVAWAPMQDTFLGPGKSTVDPTRMMIARIRFKPTGAQEASAFRRIMRPQGVALPMISMAARLHLDGETITAARVTIGPASTVPFLAEDAGAYLVGKPATPDTYKEAAERAAREATFRTSKHRSTADYRDVMVHVQLPKVLAKAVERAQSGTAEPEGVGA